MSDQSKSRTAKQREKLEKVAAGGKKRRIKRGGGRDWRRRERCVKKSERRKERRRKSGFAKCEKRQMRGKNKKEESRKGWSHERCDWSYQRMEKKDCGERRSRETGTRQEGNTKLNSKTSESIRNEYQKREHNEETKTRTYKTIAKDKFDRKRRIGESAEGT